MHLPSSGVLPSPRQLEERLPSFRLRFGTFRWKKMEFAGKARTLRATDGRRDAPTRPSGACLTRPSSSSSRSTPIRSLTSSKTETEEAKQLNERTSTALPDRDRRARTRSLPLSAAHGGAAAPAVCEPGRANGAAHDCGRRRVRVPLSAAGVTMVERWFLVPFFSLPNYFRIGAAALLPALAACTG